MGSAEVVKSAQDGWSAKAVGWAKVEAGGGRDACAGDADADVEANAGVRCAGSGGDGGGEGRSGPEGSAGGALGRGSMGGWCGGVIC